MKKNRFISIILAVAVAALTPACGILGTTGTGSSTTGETISDILGSIIGSVLGTTSTIYGTWSYTEPAVQFESESLLAKAGGVAASAKIVEEIKPYFEKAGIKEGKLTLVLNEDNTCTYTLGNKTYSGTFAYDEENSTVQIKGSLMSFPTAYVSLSGNNLALTFDSTKLLSLIQTIGTLRGTTSSTTLSTIASQYDGMKTGFAFTKQQ